MPIQFKRGTAAQWMSANPVLAAGQPGFETDTNKLKIGNGTTAWNSLPYISGGGGSGTVTSVNATGGTTGMTFSGGPITTSGSLTLGGTLVPAHGGTGISSYTTGNFIRAAGATTLEQRTPAQVRTDIAAAPTFSQLNVGNFDISGTTLVTVDSVLLTGLAAGDIIEIEVFGNVRNDTGAAQTIFLGFDIGTTVELILSGSATVATATNTPVFLRGTIGIVSTSLTYLTAIGSFNPSSSAGAAVTGTLRVGWQSTTSNMTGDQTVRVRGRGSAAGTGLELRVSGLSIWRKRL